MSVPPVSLIGSTAEENPLVAAWQDVRTSLRQSLGARSFDHWLKPVSLSGFSAEDAIIHLALPSEFMASWVRSHHGDRLLHSWRAVLPHVRGISIGVANAAVVETYAAPTESAPIEIIQQPADGYAFDPRLTFDRFVCGPANAVAANAARALAAGAPMQVNPLFIYSQTGHGKTHLLHAIGHEYQRQNPRARVLYMSAERFNQLQDTAALGRPDDD
jgi:chromosomal replication initiator protein